MNKTARHKIGKSRLLPAHTKHRLAKPRLKFYRKLVFWLEVHEYLYWLRFDLVDSIAPPQLNQIQLWFFEFILFLFHKSSSMHVIYLQNINDGVDAFKFIYIYQYFYFFIIPCINYTETQFLGYISTVLYRNTDIRYSIFGVGGVKQKYSDSALPRCRGPIRSPPGPR